MNDKYILEGKRAIPCRDLKKWAAWFERADRKVADTLSNKVHVSTVFLGVDHRFGHKGMPLLFETMIFGGEHDQFQERCSTWEEAEEMHQRACNLAGVKP